MRALADYIMRGRAQAALIAVLIVPVLPQATLALVTLRRGALDGLWVMFWAFTPMIVGLWSDAEFLPVAMIGLGTLVTVFTGALLLRAQFSWALTTIVLAAMVIAFSLVFLQAFSGEITAFLQEVIELQKANLERQGIAYDESQMELAPHGVLLAYPAFGAAVNIVFALVVGRWWQAMLYNPGGFRQEFRQLRVSPIAAAVLVLVSAACVSTDYYYWAKITALPLVMVSISMAHQFASVQRMGRTWLVIYYLALLSLPFYLLMALVGFLDAWTNIRRRLLPVTSEQQSKQDD